MMPLTFYQLRVTFQGSSLAVAYNSQYDQMLERNETLKFWCEFCEQQAKQSSI